MIEAVAHQWLSAGGDKFNLAILILVSVNILAAVLTVISIIYDAWSTKEWDFYPQTRRFFGCFPVLHPADILPLAFAIAAIIQGIVLVSWSAKESSNTLSHQCSIIAQFVWPVLWIAPYTTLVFGLDMSFRSLSRIELSSHGRWHSSICALMVLLLTFVTWLPSNLLPSNGPCLSSLIWWTAHYAQAGIAICVALIATYIICATVITVNLLKRSDLNRDERLQASIAVYYTIVSMLILSLVLPWFVQVFMRRSAISASKLAEIALNVTGIIPGLLRVLLKSDAAWTLIPHVKNCWFTRRPRTIFAPSDLDIYDHVKSPVSPYAKTNHLTPKDIEERGTESTEDVAVHWEFPFQHKNYESDPRIFEANVVSPPTILLTPSAPLQRPIYSVFPTHASINMRKSGSTTFSTGDEEMELPRPLFAYGRKRILSNQTSATVEIGLRLSQMSPACYPDELSPTSTNVPFTFEEAPPVYSSYGAFGGEVVRPGQAHDTPEDITILPTEPNGSRIPTKPLDSTSDLLSPSWFRRTSTALGFRFQGRDRNIMKSLPPVPRTVSALQAGTHSS